MPGLAVDAPSPQILFDHGSLQQALGLTPGGSGAEDDDALLSPADRSLVEAALSDLACADRPLGPVELRVRRGDGAWVDLEWHGVDLRRSAGIDAIVATVRDVSTRIHGRRELERQVDGLLALQRVDTTATSRAGVEEILRVLLVEASAHLSAAGAAILVARHDPERLEVHTTIGRLVARGSRRRGDPAFDALHRRRPTRHHLDTDSGPATVVDVPLLSRGAALGVLEVAWNRSRPVETGDRVLLQAFASRAAIALDEHRLWSAARGSRRRLEVAYDRTLEGWVRALDLRDRETEGHTRRVTEMSLRLARRFGISGEELVHLRRGAMLHDIGKLAIPDGILNKPGPLNAEERSVIEQHPDFARSFLAGIDYLEPAMEIPWAHHERWNGRGYPRGLAGDEIPLAARIFAVVDVWDALSSDRPYRAAWSATEVRRHLEAESGHHFEPRVVSEFLALLDEGDAGVDLTSVDDAGDLADNDCDAPP